jgi:hypothetical protein
MALWARRYRGPADAGARAEAMAISPDGARVYVTGESWQSFFDFATIAYDASTGVRLWVSRYDGPGKGYDDSATAIGVSSDGTQVYVTGGSAGSGGWQDYATVAYDAFTGARLWARRYSGPGTNHDAAAALAVSPDGLHVYVTGTSPAASMANQYATVSYDAVTGATQWARRYSGPEEGYDAATALGVSPDGARVYVTGRSSHDATSDYATVAYDSATGGRLWVSRYNGPANDYDIATSIGVGLDGLRVFVTGWSLGTGTSADYATVAYDSATGARLWVSRYNGAADFSDFATSLGVSSDEVFVTGASNDSSVRPHYATVAYDAVTGTKLWVRLYTHEGNDGARALAVSPDGGHVYVTGLSGGATTLDDFATVAYVAR